MNSSRFSLVKATFSTTTPMFLGGADKGARRIREASIKGAITFWWRVLHFSSFVRDAGNSEVALKTMKENEQRIFGGQNNCSSFSLSVKPGAELGIPNCGDELLVNQEKPGPGARYLGYGVMGTVGAEAGLLKRACINANKDFTISLIFKPGYNEDDKQQVLNALKLFGLLGGLGSRVRRGYGSVALKSLDGASWTPPASREEYQKCLKNLIDNTADRSQSGKDWSVTAFACESECHIADFSNMSALGALNLLGNELQRYRSWGFTEHDGKLPDGRPSEKNFKDDHDLFRDKNFKRRHPEFVPERTAFGLPHNYSKNDKYNVSGPRNNDDDKIDRRASPLMFHIHPAGASLLGVMLLLPTQFLPKREVSIGGRNRFYDFESDGINVLKHFLTGKPKSRTTADGKIEDYGNGPYIKNMIQVF